VKPIPVPEKYTSDQEFEEDSDDSDVKRKYEKFNKNCIDCSNHFMTEICDF
jgi:hypothetical protein